MRVRQRAKIDLLRKLALDTDGVCSKCGRDAGPKVRLFNGLVLCKDCCKKRVFIPTTESGTIKILPRWALNDIIRGEKRYILTMGAKNVKPFVLV